MSHHSPPVFQRLPRFLPLLADEAEIRVNHGPEIVVDAVPQQQLGTAPRHRQAIVAVAPPDRDRA
jgi:hypothetical protein